MLELLFIEGCQIMVLLLRKKQAIIVYIYYRPQLQWWCVLFKNSSLFDQSDVVKYPILTDYSGHDIKTGDSVPLNQRW